MSQSVLKEIQGVTTIYTHILYQILKMDVTIIDESCNRLTVSAKGFFKELNTDVSAGTGILKRAMESRETKIVPNPREDAECDGCTNKKNCRETYHMCTPIIYQDRAIGAIAFIALNQKQRQRAIKNQETYCQFLQQFAGLLALKVSEVIEARKSESIVSLLETVIDRIEIGVMVFGHHCEILRANKVSQNILHLDMTQADHTVDIIQTENKIMDLDEYKLTIQDRSYLVIGKKYDVNLDTYSSVFLFQETEPTLGKSFGLNGQRVSKGLNRIMGKSPQMMEIKKRLLKLARSPSPIFLYGESGTEKGALALATHEESDRSGFPFLSINCTTMGQKQLEIELFGFAKQAQLNNSKGKPGKLEAASKGTLLLEEIGDLPLPIQTRLLGALENQMVKRIGGDRLIRINTRIIATSSSNLEDLVIKSLFIKQLYYKLCVLPIQTPPLRERTTDIVLLAKHYIKKYCHSLGRSVNSIEPLFWSIVEQYPWPGNVWELQNSMEYAVNVMRIDGILNDETLPSNIRNYSREAIIIENDFSLKDMEKRVIQNALRTYGDSSEAKEFIAQRLEIGLATLYRKIKKYHL